MREALDIAEHSRAGALAEQAGTDIAAALFVRVKTVEWHLRHAYEKLGIDSREELRSKLAGRN